MTEKRHSAAGAWWSSFDTAFLRRVRRTSVIVGAVLGVPIATYFGLMPATGWLAGVVWSVLNLSAIETVVRGVLTLETRDKPRIARGLALKFGVLYGVVVFLLAVVHVPALWWVAGFTWPLFVAVMKAFGRSFLHLDAPVGARKRTS